MSPNSIYFGPKVPINGLLPDLKAKIYTIWEENYSIYIFLDLQTGRGLQFSC